MSIKDKNVSRETIERRIMNLQRFNESVDFVVGMDNSKALRGFDQLEKEAKEYDSQIDALNKKKLTITADTQQAQKELDKIESQIKDLEDKKLKITADADSAQAEIKELDDQISALEDEKVKIDADTEAGQAQIKELDMQITALEDERIIIQAETDSAEADIKDLDLQISGLQSKSILITADVDAATADLDQLEQELLAIDKASSEASAGIKSFVDDAVSGGALLASGVGIFTGLTSEVVTLGLEFDQTFAKLDTLTNEAIVPMDDLEQSILDMSSATGIAATEINDAYYQAVSAGVDVNEEYSESLEFMESAIQLSVVGFTDLSTAVDGTTTVLNAYEKDLSEADEVMNVFVETQNAGKTTVDELAKSLGAVIPSAAALGVEFEELSAMMAVMTANGVSTSEATTQLKAAFSELLDPASEVNVLFKEMTGQTMPEFLASGGDIVTGLEMINDELIANGQSWYEVMGSVEAANAMTILAKDGYDSLNETVIRLTDDNKEMADGYEEMQTPMQNVMKIQESWNNQLLEFWNVISPGVNDALSLIAENMEWIAPVVGIATVALGAFALITGGVMLTSILTATGALTAMGSAFAIMTGPIGLTIAALAAAGIAWTIYADDVGEAMRRATGDVRTESQIQQDEIDAQLAAGNISYDEYMQEKVAIAETRNQEIADSNAKMLEKGEIDQVEYNARVIALEEDLSTDISDATKNRYNDLQKQLELNEIEYEEYTQKVGELEETATEDYKAQMEAREATLQTMVDDGTITTEEYHAEIAEMEEAAVAVNAQHEQAKQKELEYRLESGLISEEDYNNQMKIMYDTDYENFKETSDKKEEDLLLQYTNGQISYETYYEELGKLQDQELEDFEKHNEEKYANLEEWHADALAAAEGNAEETAKVNEIYEDKKRQYADNTTKFYEEEYQEDLTNLETAHENGLISEAEYQRQKAELQAGNIETMMELENQKYEDEKAAAAGNAEELEKIEMEHAENVKSIKTQANEEEIAALEAKQETTGSLTEAETKQLEEAYAERAELAMISQGEELQSYETYIASKGEIDTIYQDEFIRGLEKQNKANRKAYDNDMAAYETQIDMKVDKNASANELLMIQENEKNNEIYEAMIENNEKQIAAGAENSEELAAQNEVLNQKIQDNDAETNELLIKNATLTKDELAEIDEIMGTNFVETAESMGITWENEHTGMLGIAEQTFDTAANEWNLATAQMQEGTAGFTKDFEMNVNGMNASFSAETQEMTFTYGDAVYTMNLQELQELEGKVETLGMEEAFQLAVTQMGSEENNPEVETELDTTTAEQKARDFLVITEADNPNLETELDTSEAVGDQESAVRTMESDNPNLETILSTSGAIGTQKSAVRTMEADDPNLQTQLNTSGAESKMSSSVARMESNDPTITAIANTAAAEEDLNFVARDRNSTVTVTEYYTGAEQGPINLNPQMAPASRNFEETTNYTTPNVNTFDSAVYTVSSTSVPYSSYPSQMSSTSVTTNNVRNITFAPVINGVLSEDMANEIANMVDEINGFKI